MKKLFSATKPVLLFAALALTLIGAVPGMSTAAPGDWTLTCVGPGDFCGSVETDDYIIEVYGWSFYSFEIEL